MISCRIFSVSLLIVFHEIGAPVTLEKITTFVNGLGAPYAGKNAFRHVKAFVDDIVLVEDDEVRDAMRLLYTEQKLVVESAGISISLHLPHHALNVAFVVSLLTLIL